MRCVSKLSHSQPRVSNEMQYTESSEMFCEDTERFARVQLNATGISIHDGIHNEYRIVRQIVSRVCFGECHR